MAEMVPNRPRLGAIHAAEHSGWNVRNALTLGILGAADVISGRYEARVNIPASVAARRDTRNAAMAAETPTTSATNTTATFDNAGWLTRIGNASVALHSSDVAPAGSHLA